jgi:hypothetical protein
MRNERYFANSMTLRCNQRRATNGPLWLGSDARVAARIAPLPPELIR